MADEKIEVEIVLDDGSIVKGFAKINEEADKTAKKVERSLGSALRKPINTSGIDKSLTKITSGVFNFRNALIGGLAIFGGGALLKNFAELASVQQDAVNSLNNSLRTAGTFSEEASQGFQDLASSLQANSVFGDEVILQQIALARNFTKTNEEAAKLTTAAIDLSAATGISLDSAVKNLGKTFGGLTGELGESVPALRNLTAEQLKAGAAIDLVINRFGGSALSQTQTYSGSVQQLSNTFGDLLESVGSLITESPAVVSLFNALSTTFSSLNSQITGGSVDINGFFKNLVINAAAAANAMIDGFSVLAQIPTFFEFVFVQAQLQVSKFLQGFLTLIQPVSGFLDKIFGQTGESLKQIEQNFKFIDGLEQRLVGIAGGGAKIADSFGFAKGVVEDFITTFQANNTLSVASDTGLESPAAPLIDAVDKDLVKLKTKILDAQDAITGDLQSLYVNSDTVIEANGGLFGSLADKSKADLERIGEGLMKLKTTTIAEATQIQKAVQNGLGRAIASSVGAMVTALQNGENALSAFAKSFIGVIGDLAIQIGTQLIVAGLGLQALFSLNPAGAIAFGIALVALGTLLKSFSGGGGAANAVPAGQDAVTSPVLGDGGDTGVGDGLEGGNGSSVNVVVEGNIFDSEETGLRIADVLKEQGFQNAVVT